MHMASSILLFPGQGAYAPGSLQPVANHHVVASVLSATDGVAREQGCGLVSKLLLDPASPPITTLLTQEVMRLQLTIYAQAVALGNLAVEQMPPEAMFIGHSLGEIAALTVAEACSVVDGARLVVARTAAIEAYGIPNGGMIAIGMNMERALHLVETVGVGDLSVAASNAPRQTVLSGTSSSLALATTVLSSMELPCTRLASPFAFHHPGLHRAARQFAQTVAGIAISVLARRVYSPIDGDFYGVQSEIVPRLAGHFTRPVMFLDAVRRVHAWGADKFIECNVSPVLSGLIRHSLPSSVQAEVFAYAGIPPYNGVPAVPADNGAESRQSFAAESPVHGPVATMNAVVSEPLTTHSAVESGQAINQLNLSELIDELQRRYAERLGYSVRDLIVTADLEADLGIDSMRQTELLAGVLESYGLSKLPNGFRIANYPTIESVAKYIQSCTVQQAVN